MSERSRPEYYQLIRRVLVAPAIADLNKNTGEARLAYDRVRSALIAQLRVVNWSLSKLVLAEFERLALEDAIQKVEVECRTLAATQAELVARLHPSHGPCQRHHTRQGTATESEGWSMVSPWTTTTGRACADTRAGDVTLQGDAGDGTATESGEQASGGQASPAHGLRAAGKPASASDRRGPWNTGSALPAHPAPPLGRLLGCWGYW